MHNHANSVQLKYQQINILLATTDPKCDVTPPKKPDPACPNDHGYHVSGIIAGKHGGTAISREQVTGIYPGQIDMGITWDLTQAKWLAAGGWRKMLKEVVDTIKQLKSLKPNGKAILNTSLGNACDGTGGFCVDPQTAIAEAVVWAESVQVANIEDYFLHLTAAGNIEEIENVPTWLDVRDAETGSEFNAATLLPLEKTNADGTTTPVANLSNILVIENDRAKQTASEADATGNIVINWDVECLSGGPGGSFVGGDLAGIGTDVWSFTDHDTNALAFSGTSMATPQVAGLAAYLWSIDFSASPQQLKDILKATANPVPVTPGVVCSDWPTPAPIIDAYAALLAMDAPLGTFEITYGTPVREAILDIADGSGNEGSNNAFDENDINLWIQKLINDTNVGALNFSRYDLNGDGYTGGNNKDKFNLDMEYLPLQYTTVTQDMFGTTVDFDEAALTDFQIFCYYAYSLLYTGDIIARDNALASHANDCGHAIIKDGDVVIDDAEDLVALAGVTEITGHLTISDSLSEIGAPITDLTALNSLTTIGGNLLIYNNPSLESLDGLESLINFNGSLSVGGNQALLSINGLSGLTNVSRLTISDNAVLPTLDGLEGITSPSSIYISNNTLLTSLSGLNNISTTGNLEIFDNDVLADLSALGALVEVSYFDVYGLSITNLDALTSLQSIRIWVIRNSAISGFSSLSSPPALTSITTLGITGTDGILSNVSIDGVTVERADISSTNIPGISITGAITDLYVNSVTGSAITTTGISRLLDVSDSTNITLTASGTDVGGYFNKNSGGNISLTANSGAVEMLSNSNTAFNLNVGTVRGLLKIQKNTNVNVTATISSAERIGIGSTISGFGFSPASDGNIGLGGNITITTLEQLYYAGNTDPTIGLNIGYTRVANIGHFYITPFTFQAIRPNYNLNITDIQISAGECRMQAGYNTGFTNEQAQAWVDAISLDMETYPMIRNGVQTDLPCRRVVGNSL